MNEQKKPKISLFQQARNRPQRSFLVEIDADDVRQIRPDWNEQQAVAFLNQHSGQISDDMLVAGLRTIVGLTGDADHD